MADDTITAPAASGPAGDVATTEIGAITKSEAVDAPQEDIEQDDHKRTTTGKPEDAVLETNGHTEHDNTKDSTIRAPTDEDTEMKDDDKTGGADATASAPATTGANGTPVSSKKTPNGASKKKSSIIPEHKSKKLNKKKSKPILRLEVKSGELYLARMKGHPPWPSIICDEEMLPQVLLSSRPITAAQPDGSYKKPEYADGGKRAYERTYPIMFLQTNEFAWIVNSELTPLAPEDCTDVPDKGKSKHLLEAYKIAAKGHPLSHFKTMLAEHQAALQEDVEARQEREAKKASKAKRKSVDASTAVENGDVDEMDVDDAEAESKPKSKKRKKSLVDSDGADEKPAKTPKTAPRVKLSAPKTPTTESASKKKASKAKSATKKSVAKVAGSDDEMVDTPKIEEKPLTPAEIRDKKEKEIRYYRHKLQKGFLSRDTVPAEDEIRSMSGFLSKLETYPDLEGSIIRETKIHKVLKAILKLSDIPKDEEHQFRKRSHELHAKWNKILQEDPSASATKEEKADKTKVEVNGNSRETNEQAAKAIEGEEVAPEEESPAELEKKIGTTVEGEKEAEKPEAEAEGASKSGEPNVESAPGEAYQPPATEEATATS